MTGIIDQIRIGHLSTFYHTSLVLQGLNWVEDRLNLAADWHLFGSGPAIIEAFSKGEIDIGYIGIPPVIIGIDRGVPLKCIAGGHIEGTVLVGGKELKSLIETSSIREVLQQLIGSSIGSPPKGSIHDIIVRGLLEKEKLDRDILVKNYLWADQIVEALAERKISAAIGTPSLAVAARRFLGSKVIVPPDKLWPNNPSYGIVVSSIAIREVPKLLERFLILHEEANNLIRTKPEHAATIVANVVEIVDADSVLETYRISPKYCAALSSEFIEASLAFVPLLRKMGIITGQVSADDLFDTSLINNIHPDIPHY